MKYTIKNFFLAIILNILFFSSSALACACGCGISNIGTSSLLPNCHGGIAFLQYDHIKQDTNWHKKAKSSNHNHNEVIDTKTVTAGMQYMFNREWGTMVRIPYVTRYIDKMDHNDMGHMENMNIYRTRHSDIGDIRINGIYSGIFNDMSTGITFGLKLPTGATKDSNFNRGSQIGSGSTDSILGIYHLGTFDKNNKFGYFVQTSWERPFITHRGYTPGYEISAATGVYYNLGQVSKIEKISPILQFTGAKKGSDSGFADPSHNQNSGYNTIFFTPGIELNIDKIRIYSDISLPVYRNVNGNQLVAKNLYKVILGYKF